jgi:hypothetical protein
VKVQETHTYRISGPEGVGYVFLTKIIPETGKPITTLNCTVEFTDEGVDVFKVFEDEMNHWGVEWEQEY